MIFAEKEAVGKIELLDPFHHDEPGI